MLKYDSTIVVYPNWSLFHGSVIKNWGKLDPLFCVWTMRRITSGGTGNIVPNRKPSPPLPIRQPKFLYLTNLSQNLIPKTTLSEKVKVIFVAVLSSIPRRSLALKVSSVGNACTKFFTEFRFWYNRGKWEVVLWLSTVSVSRALVSSWRIIAGCVWSLPALVAHNIRQRRTERTRSKTLCPLTFIDASLFEVRFQSVDTNGLGLEYWRNVQRRDAIVVPLGIGIQSHEVTCVISWATKHSLHSRSNSGCKGGVHNRNATRRGVSRVISWLDGLQRYHYVKVHSRLKSMRAGLLPFPTAIQH